MTAAEIKEYQVMVGKDDYISLFGYTSCSLNKMTALSFAWSNQKTGHSKVLFNIKFKREYDAYFLNAGAYDHEQEVLLIDGNMLYVVSIEDVEEDNKDNYTLITLKTDLAE